MRYGEWERQRVLGVALQPLLRVGRSFSCGSFSNISYLYLLASYSSLIHHAACLGWGSNKFPLQVDRQAPGRRVNLQKVTQHIAWRAVEVILHAGFLPLTTIFLLLIKLIIQERHSCFQVGLLNLPIIYAACFSIYLI